jgi:hypothetical protein
MEKTRLVIGVLCFLIGVGATLYVGVYWSFVGGIGVLLMDNKTSFDFITGILRILLAIPIGVLCFSFSVLIGGVIIGK